MLLLMLYIILVPVAFTLALRLWNREFNEITWQSVLWSGFISLLTPFNFIALLGIWLTSVTRQRRIGVPKFLRRLAGEKVDNTQRMR